MKGILLGDVSGSWRERALPSEGYFWKGELFAPEARMTDDTLRAAAICLWLKGKGSMQEALAKVCEGREKWGFGGMMKAWIASSDKKPYGSWANGAAMGVCAVNWFAQSETECLALAEESAMPTHNHPEAIESAQALALASWRLMRGGGCAETKKEIQERFPKVMIPADESSLLTQCASLRSYESVGAALSLGFEESSIENLLRRAHGFGGDVDTVGAMSCALLESRGVWDEGLWQRALDLAEDQDLWVAQLLTSSEPKKEPAIGLPQKR